METFNDLEKIVQFIDCWGIENVESVISGMKQVRGADLDAPHDDLMTSRIYFEVKNQ